MPVMRDLEPDECERLLRRGTFGRIGMSTPRGAEILPVNYAVDGDTIVVRTSSRGLLANHGHGADLVFEIDLVDDTRWYGWSVVARGTGAVVHHPDDDVPGRPRVRPWADGERSSELRLTWSELTGRLVGSAWDPEGAMYSRRTAR